MSNARLARRSITRSARRSGSIFARAATLRPSNRLEPILAERLPRFSLAIDADTTELAARRRSARLADPIARRSAGFRGCTDKLLARVQTLQRASARPAILCESSRTRCGFARGKECIRDLIVSNSCHLAPYRVFSRSAAPSRQSLRSQTAIALGRDHACKSNTEAPKRKIAHPTPCVAVVPRYRTQTNRIWGALFCERRQAPRPRGAWSVAPSSSETEAHAVKSLFADARHRASLTAARPLTCVAALKPPRPDSGKYGAARCHIS
jgi:hypothetical protein